MSEKLDLLERRVREAATAIAGLVEERDRLADQVSALQERLGVLESSTAVEAHAAANWAGQREHALRELDRSVRELNELRGI